VSLYRKGVTESVEIAMLSVLAIAGATTVYTTVSDSITSQEAPLSFEIDTMEPISCQRSGGTTTVTMKNTGNEQQNISNMGAIVRSQAVESSKSKELVGPGENVEITLQREVEPENTIRFVGSTGERYYLCEVAAGESGPPIPEEGGSLRVLRAEETGIKPYKSSLCIGNSCSVQERDNTTLDSSLGRTQNDYTNVGGDAVDGSLTATGFYARDVCLGSDCPADRETYGKFISDGEPEVNGTLNISSIRASYSCLGDNC
jgi:archaellum component FlaF (FlaF/FlaG flagellin family)